MAGRGIDLTLKAVIIVTRHGDRAPVHDHLGAVSLHGEQMVSYWASQAANSPEELSSKFPISPIEHEAAHHDKVLGRLTTIGANQMSSLGLKLRDYLHTKQFDVDHSNIYARSSMVHRTQLSARYFLNSFVPSLSFPIQSKVCLSYRTLFNIHAYPYMCTHICICTHLHVLIVKAR